MLFSVVTKNLNREILTKNLFTFKGWDEIKGKNFSIMGVHRKIRFLRGGGGGGGEEEPVFEGRVDTPMYSMYFFSSPSDTT